MTTASSALTLQFLAWVSDGKRTYGETMEAWRSTCPRLSIWEDAVRDGLVRVESVGAMAAARVVLTPQGQFLLDGPSAGWRSPARSVSKVDVV
jgi:hypothetical protein